MDIKFPQSKGHVTGGTTISQQIAANVPGSVSQPPSAINICLLASVIHHQPANIKQTTSAGRHQPTTISHQHLPSSISNPSLASHHLEIASNRCRHQHFSISHQHQPASICLIGFKAICIALVAKVFVFPILSASHCLGISAWEWRQ